MVWWIGRGASRGRFLQKPATNDDAQLRKREMTRKPREGRGSTARAVLYARKVSSRPRRARDAETRVSMAHTASQPPAFLPNRKETRERAKQRATFTIIHNGT